MSRLVSSSFKSNSQQLSQTQKGSSTTAPLLISPTGAPVGTRYGSSIGPLTIPGVYTVTRVEFCAFGSLPVLRNSFVIFVESWSTTMHYLAGCKSIDCVNLQGKLTWSSPCRSTRTPCGMWFQVYVAHSVTALKACKLGYQHSGRWLSYPPSKSDVTRSISCGR